MFLFTHDSHADFPHSWRFLGLSRTRSSSLTLGFETAIMVSGYVDP